MRISPYVTPGSLRAVYTREHAVHEVRLDRGAARWVDVDLTHLTRPAGPGAFYEVHGCMAGGMPRVFYIETDNGHVHELRLDNGGWQDTDLCQQSGAPAAVPVLGVMAYDSPDAVRVLYAAAEDWPPVRARGPLHELRLPLDPTSRWEHATITPGSMRTESAPWGYADSAGVLRVVFVVGHDVHELVLPRLTDASWGEANLTSLGGGQPVREFFEISDHVDPKPPPPPGITATVTDPRLDPSDPRFDPNEFAKHAHPQRASFTPMGPGGPRFGMSRPHAFEAAGTRRVVYTGDDHHVHELHLGPQGWFDTDLTKRANAPLIDGNPFGYEAQGAVRVVYRDWDDHVHELFLTPGSDWRDADLREASMNGAPFARRSPVGYNDGAGSDPSSGRARVVFMDPHAGVHELVFPSTHPRGTGWLHALMY